MNKVVEFQVCRLYSAVFAGHDSGTDVADDSPEVVFKWQTDQD